MKKILTIITSFVLLTVFAAGSVYAKESCATIKDGTITDSAGNPVVSGYDKYGYNYQAHMFNGTYDSSDRKIDGTYWGDTGDYVDDKLMMKWSDAWLANVDCDGDHKLDRGLVDGVVRGISMGWLTNHVVGDYTDAEGNPQNYTDFVKIVWTGPGSPLWGQYTIIQEVLNDPSAGHNGLFSKIGTPGFGLNDHWTTL
ncbi:MAG: hypothetical protein M1575_01050 [Patescibacteria group bacterium]|nr:hypothetical protein [Patescibacteria group bacterium]MCL5095307.1 hypothetical protein [Patescibacteria group bacterium]